MSSLLFVGITVLAGWVASWPLREGLGPTHYHLAALPLGLLAWTFVSATAVVLGTYDMLAVAVGMVSFVLIWRLLAMYLMPSAHRAGHRGRSTATGFLVAGTAYLVATATLATARTTVTTADSWKGYWPLGVMLESSGTYTSYLPAARGFTLPSISAASLFCGNEWEYVVYPLLAGVLVLGITFTLARTDLRGLGSLTVAIVCVAVAAFLLTDPSFLYHSLYVHSHLMSAAYLFLALAGIRFSFDPATGQKTPNASAWLLIAGAATSGLALTRPDGLAYAFVPIVIAVAVISDGRRGATDAHAFFGPLLVLVGVPLVTAYLEVGWWQAEKLDGRLAAAIYLLMVAAAFVPVGLGWVRERARLRIEAEHIVRGAVAGGVVLVFIAALMRWDIFGLAVLNAGANLFGVNGAYAFLWHSLTVILVVSVFSGDAARRGAWSALLFSAIVLFFFTAAMVHGTSHPGRVGTGDSFSRVAFHIVPVIVWYAAVISGRALKSVSRG